VERFLYTVIGDAVNVAARLETLTKDYPEHHILMNGEVYKGIADRPGLDFVNLGPQQVKGRTQPVDVYAVKQAGYVEKQALP